MFLFFFLSLSLSLSSYRMFGFARATAAAVLYTAAQKRATWGRILYPTRRQEVSGASARCGLTVVGGCALRCPHCTFGDPRARNAVEVCVGPLISRQREKRSEKRTTLGAIDNCRAACCAISPSLKDQAQLP